MCGRFTLRAPTEALAALLELQELTLPIAPRYNIAPSQNVLACRQSPSQREVTWLKWGLIPSWATDPKIAFKLINARAETIAEKPSFRSAFRHRRCVVLADGFYEWQPTGKRKQPYLFSLASGEPFGLAALWESWQSPEGVIVESCSLITTEANDVVRPVHDRMPVMFDRTGINYWLDKTLPPAEAKSLLRSFPAVAMIATPVHERVNNPRYDGPDCIEQLQVA